MRFLERARFQDITYDERQSAAFQEAAIARIASDLGRDETECRILLRNRNADVYRFGGDVLKFLTSKPRETLRVEFESLRELSTIARASGAFRVPEPVALYVDDSAYVMGHVAGDRLDRMIVRADPGSLAATRAAGVALGVIHRARQLAPAPVDGEALRRDLEHLPWKVDARERATLDRVLVILAREPQSRARLYMDYDPVNVLVDGQGGLSLLDPPEAEVESVCAWDVGVFTFGVQRAAWREPHRLRAHARREAAYRAAFLDAYRSQLPAEAQPDELAIAFAEYLRLAQLWMWWQQPLHFRRRVEGIARALYSRPLLRHARARGLARLRDLASER